ncbi:MAG: fibronectin type III domain-containing protein [Betaproteobacteria bacterium]|nr:fibronectin type III domain-containing protein [Betaproteobacteria bacterium]
MNRFFRWSSFLLVAFFAGSVLAQNNAQSPLGINLVEVRYWASELSTVDFFKRAGNGESGVWLTQCDNGCGWNSGEQSSLDLDENGWPRSLPAAGSTARYRYVTTILVREIGNRYPAGRYTVLYEGAGTLAYSGDAVRNAAASSTGIDIVDVTPSQGFYLTIRATDPQRTGNYLRNIRVIPPGGDCNGDQKQYAADASVCPAVFRPFTDPYYVNHHVHPLFLKDIQPFSALRFVHMASVITTQVREWVERPQMRLASWAGAADGAPIEFAIEIANALNASPWFEIPAKASDDYVRQFARLAKATLSTSRPIYLEYHNEAWNNAYPYITLNSWVEQQATARWPGPTPDAFAKRINWFGMRTGELCRIWKEEFADQPGRVKCVMAAQSGNSWVASQALSCPLYAAEAGHNCAGQIDVLAIAPYFGGYISQAAFQSTVGNWFQEPDGGLGSLFREINNGLLPRVNNQPLAALQQIYMGIDANKAVANTYGLPLIAYEGGQELSTAGNDPFKTSAQNLFATANRDARMGAAYTAMFNYWKQAGGGLFTVYDSTAVYSATRGNSALLEYQGQPRTQAPKYDAALSFISANNCWWSGCSTVGAPAAPISVSVAAGSGRATVTFGAPANNGSGAIIGYTASCSASGYPTRTRTGSSSPITVRGLAGGVAYTCAVAASNEYGTGMYSEISPVTPLPAKGDITPVLMLLLD